MTPDAAKQTHHIRRQTDTHRQTDTERGRQGESHYRDIQSPKHILRHQTSFIGGARRGLGEAQSPKMSLSPLPTVKRTGQESGGELCEIFKC